MIVRLSEVLWAPIVLILWHTYNSLSIFHYTPV